MTLKTEEQRCDEQHEQHGQGAVLNLPVPEHEAESEPLNCLKEPRTY